MICTAYKNGELKHAGYAILHGIADPLFSSAAIQYAADIPMEYPVMKMEKLYEFMISTFPGKEALGAEKMAHYGNLLSISLWIS